MSKLPFEMFMALRYLRPKRTFVSIISIISVLGVMLGVAVMIIVIGVMSGFDRDLRDRFFSFQSHIRVGTHTGIMDNYEATMEVVREHPRVTGVTPYVMGQILIKTQPDYGSSQIAAQLIRGIDLETEGSVSQLLTNVVEGELDLIGSSIAVGTSFAENLGLRIDDRVAVYSNRHLEHYEENRDAEDKSFPLPDDFKVQAVFDLGYYEYNSTVAVTSLENAQELYNLDNKVHGLMVMVDDSLAVQEIRQALMTRLGPGYRVGTWMDNSSLLDAVVVEKNVMFIVIFFITIVAAFGIMNSLITFVINKTREIGILKALGASHGQVFGLFLTQSMVVGVTGVITGLILGITGLTYRNQFLHFMRKTTGMELFPEDVYGFKDLPALMIPGDVALTCGSALVACFLAAIIPVRIAMKMKPVNALRHE